MAQDFRNAHLNSLNNLGAQLEQDLAAARAALSSALEAIE